MSADQFQWSEYFNRHQICVSARDYINSALENPSRRVGSHSYKNVVGFVASEKNEQTIQVESHTVEHPIQIDFELNPDIPVYACQPPSVHILRTVADKKRSNRQLLYTPDYMVISMKEGPLIVEVKTADEVAEKLEKYPEDWKQDTGGIHYLPAERAFRDLGLRHVVMTPQHLTPIRTENSKLLICVIKSPVEPIAFENIQTAFGEAPFLRIDDLLKRLDIVDNTPILKWVIAKKLFVRFDRDLLTNEKTCWISQDHSQLEYVPEEVCYRVPDLRTEEVRLPSDAAMAGYVRRKQKLKEKGRTGRRLRRNLRLQMQSGKTEFEILLPDYDRCGDRSVKILPEQETIINEFIDSDLSSDLRLNCSKAYQLYRVKAHQTNETLPPVSKTTFQSRIDLHDPKQIAQGRGGKRAANQAELPTDVESRALKPTRPFQAATMDHYNANIHLILGTHAGKTYTARPWITALIDLYDKSILALWISLLPPSTRACAMLLRFCVRDLKRLPESIIVDRGKEFQSIYFMKTLADKGVDLFLRPSAAPKFGSEVERFFGQIQTNFLTFMKGNFANLIEARGISPSHTPSATAEVQIGEFWTRLRAYQDFHNANGLLLGQPDPIILREDGLRRFSCSGIPINESAEFLVDTAIDLRDYCIEDTGCIRTRGQRFYSPYQQTLRALKRKPRVKVEMENPHIIYFELNDQWHIARASGCKMFETLDLSSRFAESMRLGECSNIQTAMRQHVQEEFIRTNVLATPDINDPGKDILTYAPVAPDQDVEASIFDRVRQLDVTHFVVNPYAKVSDYELGKVGE